MSAARAADDVELAYAIIEPHFDAVRDHYAEFTPVGAGAPLEAVRRTKLIVDDTVRDSDRHYAACRDDGLLVVIAPQAARLPFEQMLAILCHEMGHATDFLYPGRWLGRRGKRAEWVPDGAKKMARIRRLWSERNDDQVEFDADSIAQAVTGRRIEYCGPCLLQCFSGGVTRPPGLE